ncbi:MAG: type II toxin-antitoxin system RelE/ParE family toxin [Methanomicrobiales archaeon]
MTFDVKVRNTADAFIGSVPEKSRRIIRNALQSLCENPFPGSGGDKEKLILRGGREIYLLHIARTYTVFYSVDDENRIVRVHEILPIEQAHKKYGRL